MKGRSCSCLAVLVLLFLAAVAGVLFYVAYPIVFAPPPEPEETEWPIDLEKIARADWGNQEIANPDRISPMGGISCITIHHDGLPPLAMVTEKQIKKRVVAIREDHSRKYADIGYHYIVGPKGRIWEGRPIQYQGAHAQRHNANNIGVLFLGNTIYPHAELGKTECPGKHLQDILDVARKDGTLEYPEVETTVDWQSIKERLLELPKEIKKLVE